MNELPRITLVTPSYNQGAYLESAIQSVLTQNFPKLEYIMMDGGSSDNSIAILRQYAAHFAYWTSEPDTGQADALKRGFARATGEILGWLNADDVLLPNALHTVAAFFFRHPDCDFLTGDSAFINADASREVFEVRAAPYSFDDLLHYYADKYLPQPSVFFSRAAFQHVGGLDASLRYMMDLDLFLRLRREYALHYIPQRLSLMRIHPAAKGQQAGQPALHAVEQVTRRYWNSRGPAERVQIWWGLQKMQALEAMKYGLERVQQNDSRAGWSACVSGLVRYPPALLSPIGQRLMVRLVLPRSLRRRWLSVP